MSRQPIAFVDASGFVSLPPLNVKFSEYARDSLLTPLFTQEEVEAANARFYVAQGLNPDGSDPTPATPSLEVEAQIVEAAAADRKEVGKAATGVSVAEAAQAALREVGMTKGKK